MTFQLIWNLSLYFFRFFCMNQHFSQSQTKSCDCFRSGFGFTKYTIKQFSLFQICVIQNVGQWDGPLHPLWSFYQPSRGQVWESINIINLEFVKNQSWIVWTLWCEKPSILSTSNLVKKSINHQYCQPRICFEINLQLCELSGLRGTWSRSTRCTATMWSCSSPSTSSQVSQTKQISGKGGWGGN